MVASLQDLLFAYVRCFVNTHGVIHAHATALKRVLERRHSVTDYFNGRAMYLDISGHFWTTNILRDFDPSLPKNDYVIYGRYLKHILHHKYIWKLHWYFRKGRSCKYFQFFHIRLCPHTFVYSTLLGAYNQFDTHMKRIPRKICIKSQNWIKIFKS